MAINQDLKKLLQFTKFTRAFSLPVCGLGAGALHQSTLCVEKRSDIEQCHTTVKSEAVGMKKLVGSTQQVNPELLRYVCIY